MAVVRPEVLHYFEERTEEMVEFIQRFCALETSSNDVPALERFAAIFAPWLQEQLGVEPQILNLGHDKRPHIRVDLGGKADVLMIGHFDTVYPSGTAAEYPSFIDGDELHGIGALDMKSGVVIMVEVARWLQAHQPWSNLSLVFTSDEEIGSETAGPLLREIAADASAILVLEYSDTDGGLRNGNRGFRQLRITVTGSGGHAAYPERNVNPVDALADVIMQARRFHRPEHGIVVTPTVIDASTAVNIVPDTASVLFDVRGTNEELLDEVEQGFSTITLPDERYDIAIDTFLSVPTLPRTDDNYAEAVIRFAARQLGIPEPRFGEARGASDANQVAPVNTHVVEGLGGWGDGAHSAHREFVRISSLAPSAAMAALAIEKALSNKAIRAVS